MKLKQKINNFKIFLNKERKINNCDFLTINMAIALIIIYNFLILTGINKLLKK